MRASARPNVRNRNGGRQSAIRNTPRIGRGATEVTRREDSYHNATRLLTERSEEISRLYTEYRNYEQRGEILRQEVSRLDTEYHERQSKLVASEESLSNWSTRVERNPASDYEASREIHQTSLHQAASRTNASQVELLIEREGRIIQTVDWEVIQVTPPLPEYATQRAQAPHRTNIPYNDGEIRALSIIERLRNREAINPGDRVIIRGPTAPCADCQHNVRNYAVRHNLNIHIEYTGPQAILNARQAAPERNLTHFYGRVQDVRVVRAPLDNGLFHRIPCNNRNLRIPRDQNEISRQLRGRNVTENEGRVASGGLRNPPAAVQEQLREAIAELVAPPEEVLTRLFRK